MNSDSDVKEAFKDWMSIDSPATEEELLQALKPYLQEAIFEELSKDGAPNNDIDSIITQCLTIALAKYDHATSWSTYYRSVEN